MKKENMTSKEKYVGAFGIEIKEEEKQNHRWYKKVIELEGEQKKILSYYKGELDYIIYYLNSLEQDSEVLTELKEAHPNCESFYLIEKEKKDGYHIEHERIYHEGNDIYPWIHRSIVNEEGAHICSENITLGKLFSIDNSRQEESVRTKYFYNEFMYAQFTSVDEVIKDSDFLVFEAKYKPDGSFDHAKFAPVGTDQNRYYEAVDYDELVARCNLSTKWAKYYFTDTFLPSNSLD